MNIGAWLVETMVRLKEAGVDSPRRDALVLLEDMLQKDRAWVTAHPEFELDNKILAALQPLIRRRLQREPLAYIRGKAWFYGRFFALSSSVLIPRPESESFIELLKELHPPTIVDIGTGSGALAITAMLELPKSQVYASDTSLAALQLARSNAKAHHAKVTFLHGSLLEPYKNVDLSPAAIAANLPYVPKDLITSPEITQEPQEALFSGVDGLDHYRTLWHEVGMLSKRPPFVLIEALESQHEQLKEQAEKVGYRLKRTETLVQLYQPVA
jgi:release factor glutamine methyltransferase